MNNIWLHRFAVLTAGATFILIFIGGLVTSTGSGLAVPDWPLSFGQFFPPMEGGVLFEHGHRMAATLVGFLMTLLAIWIYWQESRRWVRRLGLIALLAIILQGLLGGITVLLKLPTSVSVAHACLAQAFFCLTIALAVFTNPNWGKDSKGGGKYGSTGERKYGRVGAWEYEGAEVKTHPHPHISALSLTRLGALTTAVIYVQLILGAIMRHMGAGLAIPDFPLAFGRLVPPLESSAVLIHYLHRLGALLVTLCISWTVIHIIRQHRQESFLLRPGLLLIGLLILQIALGAFTIWTFKAVLPTTLHVTVGAAILATSLILTLRSYQVSKELEPGADRGLTSGEVLA
ncbi:MAG TPA: COX15/CtaA family protein [Candidatus Limnocylindrales bacterium]|nr:COX15/CtaA family protein [Candidatus Limnocylindrales bacterium]